MNNIPQRNKLLKMIEHFPNRPPPLGIVSQPITAPARHWTQTPFSRYLAAAAGLGKY